MAAYTAGFLTHVTCRPTAKNRDQLMRSVIEYGLGLPLPSIFNGKFAQHEIDIARLVTAQKSTLAVWRTDPVQALK